MNLLLQWFKPPATGAGNADDSDNPWLGAEAMIAPGWLRELDDGASRGASADSDATDWRAL